MYICFIYTIYSGAVHIAILKNLLLFRFCRFCRLIHIVAMYISIYIILFVENIFEDLKTMISKIENAHLEETSFVLGYRGSNEV